MTYEKYLKLECIRASAARRKRMRQIPEPCMLCGAKKAEATEEGIFLCKMHKSDMKTFQPVRSYEERLRHMNYPFATKEEFEAGNYKQKTRKPPEPVCKFKPLKYNGTGKTMK